VEKRKEGHELYVVIFAASQFVVVVVVQLLLTSKWTICGLSANFLLFSLYKR